MTEIEEGSDFHRKVIGPLKGTRLYEQEIGSSIPTLIYGPSVACHCVDIKMGSYDNQVEMRTPWGQQVCIDTCLATIVAWLWHHGVTTLNSCCGHGKLTPSVIVSPDAIDLMYQLGFQLDDAGSAVPDQTFSLVRLSDNDSTKKLPKGEHR